MAIDDSANQNGVTRREWFPLLIICLALVLLQVRYGICSQDDAFISFRYAANLVDGHGLVFNPGERVEGYTNFLWTMLFVPVIGVGLEPTGIAASLGMVFSTLLLWTTWEMGGRRWLAPMLVLTFPGLGLEGVQGLETVAFAWLVSMTVWGGLADAAPARVRKGWPLFAGLAALTRPEGWLVYVLVWGLRWLGFPAWRKTSWKAWLGFGALVLPHLAFRLIYYGRPLPNTFYAKVGGFAIDRGLTYIGEVMWVALPLFVLALFGAIAIVRKVVQEGWSAQWFHLSLACLVGVYLTYVVMVGGDFKGTGRFVIPVLGLVALVAQSWVVRWRYVVGLAALGWSVPEFREMDFFAQRFSNELVQRRAVGEFLATVVPPDAVIAVHAAGIVPYYSGRPTLDMWGLNDLHIAQAEVENLGTGTAGHERHDYQYVMDRAPLIILPERDLVTTEPFKLPDPLVFGEQFEERYRPLSLKLDGSFLNLWRLRESG